MKAAAHREAGHRAVPEISGEIEFYNKKLSEISIFKLSVMENLNAEPSGAAVHAACADGQILGSARECSSSATCFSWARRPRRSGP